MANIKKRGLDSLIPQSSHSVPGVENRGRYIRTIGFKVTERQYETYRRYSKYFGSYELIKKWRRDLDEIEQEKGKDMESAEMEIRKRLTK
ncbi:MAG: hypothetical protein QXG08_06715 [Candidatus Methanomethyliaceae archaeon]